MFRLLQIYVLAIYRAACDEDQSLLPFVYSFPRPDALMRKNDKLYVFCNPAEYESVLENVIDYRLHRSSDGRLSLQEKENVVQDNSQASKKRKGAFVVTKPALKLKNSRNKIGVNSNTSTPNANVTTANLSFVTDDNGNTDSAGIEPPKHLGLRSLSKHFNIKIHP
jgi:hypothetical protein